MNFIRAFFLRHRALACLLVAAALCLKSVVPAGYMVGQDDKVLTVLICDPGSPHAVTRQIAIPMKDTSGTDDGRQWQGDCAYSSLSMVSTGGADPALLALALVFILMLGFMPLHAPARSRRISHLRPPLRGPPAFS